MSSPLTLWQVELNNLITKYSVISPLTPQQASFCSDEEKRQYAFALYQLENRRFHRGYKYCFEMEVRIFLGEVDERVAVRELGQHAGLEYILKRHSNRWEIYCFSELYKKQTPVQE